MEDHLIEEDFWEEGPEYEEETEGEDDGEDMFGKLKKPPF